MAIQNTHYNLIDTLIHAYGLEKWNELCYLVVPQLIEKGIQRFGDAFIINGGANYPSSAWYTICECIFWGINEGDYYRIPKTSGAPICPVCGGKGRHCLQK